MGKLSEHEIEREKEEEGEQKIKSKTNRMSVQERQYLRNKEQKIKVMNEIESNNHALTCIS